MEVIAVLTLIAAVATLVVGLINMYVDYRTRPPKGYDISHDATPNGEVITFGALGSARLYSVRFRSHGAVMLMPDGAYDEWPLGTGVRVVDVEREVRVPIGYLVGPGVEPPTVEVSWVSDIDRYNVRERLRYHLDTWVMEEWRRYRVRLWRKQPGRWVESKRADEPEE